jgi:YfiH family protein
VTQDIPTYLQSDELAAVPGISHGFFTRKGGVSNDIYDSLNCGFGSSDDPQKVAENRLRVSCILGVEPSQLTSVYQVHGTHVHIIEERADQVVQKRADAMATNIPGCALAILTADCAPVLFANPDANVVAAAHAGWRGTLDGIISSTVSAMTELGADPAKTTASVGPCIGSKTYEVGPEFPDAFIEQCPENRQFFTAAPCPGHFLFDLPGFITSVLSDAGVGLVEHVIRDTLSDEDNFFSYRRARHRGETDYGRQISAITLIG